MTQNVFNKMTKCLYPSIPQVTCQFTSVERALTKDEDGIEALLYQSQTAKRKIFGIIEVWQS